MPIYEFTARRPSGELIQGSDQARNRTVLKSELAARGLVLAEAKVVRGGALALPGRAKVSSGEMRIFIREFRHLVASGLPIGRCIEILQDRPEQPALAEAIAAMRRGLEEGEQLDEAAARRPDVFDRSFQAALRAGLRTGRLSTSLERYQQYIDLRDDMRRKIRKSLAYPIFLLGLLVVVIMILMLFVLPRFAELYDEFGADIPTATRLLMTSVNTAPIWIPAMLAGGALALLGLRLFASRPGGQYRLDALVLTLPIVGGIVKELQLVRISYLLSMLLQAGTPLKDALGFAAEGSNNAVMSSVLRGLVDSVKRGENLSDALAGTDLYPTTSLGMIRAGESSGTLDVLFDAIAQIHEQSVDERMARLLALVEPTITLLVGVLLGAVIITVYLPVFGVSEVVQ